MMSSRNVTRTLDANSYEMPSEGSLEAQDQYIHLVHRTPAFQEGEETRLLKVIASGNLAKQRATATDDFARISLSSRLLERARSRLVEGYQPLIISLARPIAWRCQHLTCLDLVQEGNVGLLQAINGYNGRLPHASFRSWVGDWIRGAMLAAYWHSERTIRIPTRTGRALRRLDALLDNFLSIQKREPTPQEIAQAMRIPQTQVCELLVLRSQQVVSLQRLVNDDESLGFDTLRALAVPGTWPEVNNLTCERLYEALNRLSSDSRQVIAFRYGFVDGQERTQQEVADALDLPLPQVGILERRGRFWLRKFLSESLKNPHGSSSEGMQEQSFSQAEQTNYASY